MFKINETFPFLNVCLGLFDIVSAIFIPSLDLNSEDEEEQICVGIMLYQELIDLFSYLINSYITLLYSPTLL